MCGNEECAISARIKLKVWTPNVEVNGYNLRQEVFFWIVLPVPNPKKPEHFPAPAAARQYINTYTKSFERLKQFMPYSKEDTDKNKLLKQSNKLDKDK